MALVEKAKISDFSFKDLSKNEISFLGYISDGLSDTEIARKLDISLWHLHKLQFGLVRKFHKKGYRLGGLTTRINDWYEDQKHIHAEEAETARVAAVRNVKPARSRISDDLERRDEERAESWRKTHELWDHNRKVDEYNRHRMPWDAPRYRRAV